jgi:hypothetical protein
MKAEGDASPFCHAPCSAAEVSFALSFFSADSRIRTAPAIPAQPARGQKQRDPLPDKGSLCFFSCRLLVSAVVRYEQDKQNEDHQEDDCPPGIVTKCTVHVSTAFRFRIWHTMGRTVCLQRLLSYSLYPILAGLVDSPFCFKWFLFLFPNV